MKELSFKQRMHNSQQFEQVQDRKSNSTERREYRISKKDFTMYPSYKYTLEGCLYEKKK